MRRFLHTFPEAPALAGRNVVRAAPVADPRLPQTSSFTVLGLGSLLQVQLPPSIELYARRGALAGILGQDALAASLTSRLKIARSPLMSILARQPLLQQKIIGTSPLTCLIASTKNEFLSTIELDGTLDWVVKSPIHAFSGRQLRSSIRSGWRPGSPPFAHTVVSGRGWLCMGSPASTVQINVPQGESVLVSKSHLNAFSVDTNAAQKPVTLREVDFKFGELKTSSTEVEDTIAPEIPAKKTREVLPPAFKKVLSYAGDIYQTTKRTLETWLRSGNSGAFVEIYGPSTVIVSAASRPPQISSTSKQSPQ